MKNDITATLLSFLLAILVVAGVLFAYLTMKRGGALRGAQPVVQAQLQTFQVVSARAQALLNDTIAYNATVKSTELQQIIVLAQTPTQAVAK